MSNLSTIFPYCRDFCYEYSSAGINGFLAGLTLIQIGNISSLIKGGKAHENFPLATSEMRRAIIVASCVTCLSDKINSKTYGLIYDKITAEYRTDTKELIFMNNKEEESYNKKVLFLNCFSNFVITPLKIAAGVVALYYGKNLYRTVVKTIVISLTIVTCNEIYNLYKILHEKLISTTSYEQ
ncbi:MAG: hypothetical protein Q8K60_04985 [Parachlamydiaceae bacterium]|nr:hypothetical protein [Parachlamydiaceae bacterium]